VLFSVRFGQFRLFKVKERRPLGASRDTGANGRRINASTSQDEEHWQPAEPEQGDTEASPNTHPLY